MFLNISNHTNHFILKRTVFTQYMITLRCNHTDKCRLSSVILMTVWHFNVYIYAFESPINRHSVVPNCHYSDSTAGNRLYAGKSRHSPLDREVP